MGTPVRLEVKQILRGIDEGWLLGCVRRADSFIRAARRLK